MGLTYLRGLEIYVSKADSIRPSSRVNKYLSTIDF